MKKKPVRVMQKLENTPHLVTPEFVELAFQVLGRDTTASLDDDVLKEEKKKRQCTYNGAVGIIPIDGPLTYKATGFEPLCGGVSYQQLEKDVKKCIKEGVSVVVLDVDSPGGEAYGVFEAASYIKNLCKDSNVRLLTYVDGLAASAAYALASVSDEIIANPDSELGSIGVVTRLSNKNKKEKEDGVEVVYIYAGESKVPFDKEGSFKKGFLEDLQEKVNILYDRFVGHVSTNRNVSEEAVRGTQAKCFMADKALSLGLCDKLMTREDFYSYLLQEQPRIEGKNMSIDVETLEVKMADSEKVLSESKMAMEELEAKHMASIKEMQEKMEAMQAEMASILTAKQEAEGMAAALAAEKNAKERAELTTKLETYAFLDEEGKTALVDFMFENKAQAAIVLNAFDKAAALTEKFATMEHGVTGEAPVVSVDENLSKAVLARFIK